ncbi:MAG: EAL domain-containing protein [Thiobacillus sp.]|nr:EAL domain-containing protein [Thiobacillus sp.]
MPEDAGLIGSLTHWVLKTALKQQETLHRLGHNLTLAVNLSARNLHDMELPASILTLLAERGIAPGDLTLEITESAVMANPSDGLAILTDSTAWV